MPKMHDIELKRSPNDSGDTPSDSLLRTADAAADAPKRSLSALYLIPLGCVLLVVAFLLSRSASPQNRFYLTNARAIARRATTTVVYDFTIDRTEGNFVDGVWTSVYTINGQFPGPTIECRSGDTVQVNVHNAMDEPTALHWHGIKFRPTDALQDGAVGVTQCPIAPGASHTYTFTLRDDQAGTFWYHSHESNQRGDGMYGAFIVHAPEENSHTHSDSELKVRNTFRPRGGSLAPRELPLRHANQSLETTFVHNTLGTDTEEVILMLGDWYHRSSSEVYDWYMSLRSRGKEPVPDSILINGQQKFVCSRSRRKVACDSEVGTVPVYAFDPAKTYRLRLVNTGSLADLYFSVDGHELEVVEADGELTEPMRVSEVTLSPGQRYSVLLRPELRADMHHSRFWLRTSARQRDFMYPNPSLDLDSKGILYYLGESTSEDELSAPEDPNLGPDILAPVTQRGRHRPFDAHDLKPLLPQNKILPSSNADHLMVYVSITEDSMNHDAPTSYVNHTSWRPSLIDPIMGRHDLDHGPSWTHSQNEFIVDTMPYMAKNTSIGSTVDPLVVDLIINNVEFGPHPFHLHGHQFYVLEEYAARVGIGHYNYATPSPNPESAPVRRDTIVVPERGYSYLRVVFDTPGLWMFHCHIIMHQSAGMALVFNHLPWAIDPSWPAAARELCPSS